MGGLLLSLHDDDVETILRNVQATRFVSAAGVVILLYDHLLTLDKEVKLIWRAPWILPKYLFLLMRYPVPMVIVVYTVQLSGLADITLSDQFCTSWTAFSVFFGLITIAISNFIVLLRIWVLWDRSRVLIYGTLAFFIATQLSAIIAVAYAINDMKESLVWNDSWKLCTFVHKFHTAPIWVPGIVFEVVVFCLTWVNAMYRPRSANDELALALYRDGFTYFVTLLTLRLFNFIMAIVAPASLLYLGALFIWCSTTVTTTRFVLGLRQIAAIEPEESNEHDDVIALTPAPLARNSTYKSNCERSRTFSNQNRGDDREQNDSRCSMSKDELYAYDVYELSGRYRADGPSV